MTFLYITIFLLIIYIGLIVIFTVGWRKTPNFQSQIIDKPDTKITIVIACKNEEKNLPQLLQALNNQTYNIFELIIVNDHSTDLTQEIAENQLSAFHNAKVLKSTDSGKKNAIAQGIQSASGKLIITTDADCIPEPEWVETILNFYNESQADLIICPVKMIESDSLFSKIQTLEFTSLIASGAGAAGIGMPIMCNAANMAFTKKAWFESKKDLHPEEPSGDDVFLLLSIKKRKSKIKFLKSQKALVYTHSSQSIKAFFKQRSRWAGKSKFYTDGQIITVGLIITAISLTQILWLILSLFNIHFLLLFFLILIIKIGTDILFLYEVNSFFKLKNLFRNALLISLVYPLYVLSTLIKAFIRTEKDWK